MDYSSAKHTTAQAVYKNITHIISIDNANLWVGQVDIKGLLPVWQKLQGKQIYINTAVQLVSVK